MERLRLQILDIGVDIEYMREAFQKAINTNRAYICVSREE